MPESRNHSLSVANRLAMTGNNEILLKEFLEKARKYCSYSERCTAETTARLKQMGASFDQVESIISALVQEGYLNDERYAGLFARSKFNHNQWGRIKIGYELSARRIAPENIRAALAGLDEQKYEEALLKIISQKVRSLKGIPASVIKGKIIAYCLRKGFEPDLCSKLTEKFLISEMS